MLEKYFTGGWDLYMFQHEKWTEKYNCALIDVGSIPMEDRNAHPNISYLLIVLGIFYYILYIPCMFSFIKNYHREKGDAKTCYGLMLYISITDMGALWIVTVLHGWLSLNGAMFCSYPELIYFAGGFAIFCSSCETWGDLALAINRCLDIIAPSLSEKIFKGRRLWLLALLFTLEGVWVGILNAPILFNGLLFVWLQNPYFGYPVNSSFIYQNEALAITECFLALGTPFVYLFFMIIFSVKMKKWMSLSSTGDGIIITKAKKKVFIQVVLISFFNFTAAGIYYLAERAASNQTMISKPLLIFAHLAWVQIHGAPPVIYLALNNTVRQDCKLLLIKIFKPHKIRRVNNITYIVRTKLLRTTTLRDGRIGPNNLNMIQSRT